jgi:preprotein translocase subunit SecE
MAEVQTPAASSSKDHAIFGLAIVCVLAGVIAFYWFDESNLLLRIAMVVAGLAAGFGLMWSSSYGRDFVQFFHAARIELRKVVWPTREETIQTTLVVFVFAAIMGVFFFLLDLLLSWMTRFLGG